MENYCERAADQPAAGGGLGYDGGMAEYMLVPAARLLVPLGELDPVDAAPLTDAAHVCDPEDVRRQDRLRRIDG